MSRSITPKEAAIVRWLLDNAPKGDVTAYRARPVEELRVFEKFCKDDCASLDFEPDGGGWGHARIIADALAIYPDGQEANLILWGREGEIVLLEVSDCQPGSSRRVPEVANLRAWEQRGQEIP